MAIKLTKQTMRKIDELQSAIGTARSRGIRMLPEALRRGVGAQGAKDIKQLGRDIMAEVLGVDARGTPKGPLEAAAAKAVRADSDNVRKRIASLVARGDPTPADYYDILNKVLVDSGSIMLTDPKVVRGGLEAVRASGKCYCEACNACWACAACPATGTAGLVAAGVAGVTVSTWV